MYLGESESFVPVEKGYEVTIGSGGRITVTDKLSNYPTIYDSKNPRSIFDDMNLLFFGYGTEMFVIKKHGEEDDTIDFSGEKGILEYLLHIENMEKIAGLNMENETKGSILFTYFEELMKNDRFPKNVERWAKKQAKKK
ncbi:MAG: hypothetical protein V3U72_04335 [Candidatus Aenigmarchaeota archaeon]